MDANQPDEPLPEIRTVRLVIADAAGAPRIILGLDDEGEPAIQLFDDRGAECALLTLAKAPIHEPVTIAQLRLAAAEGLACVDLMAAENGRGVIEMSSHPDEFANLLLEVEREQGGRQAAILLGNSKASIGIQVQDDHAEFHTNSGSGIANPVDRVVGTGDPDAR